ncbi:uncharacterized protein A4U43_C03F26160 [Asparagus officinalis]|uniref:Glutathione peroxidase n=1 Tax=Asparagus officinalis TaxID=4686 RepID=A0A5P1FI87_ASPOF|nr:uncharacterized protein A4U43_C03F26160 [Asparagus officinalis]
MLCTLEPFSRALLSTEVSFFGSSPYCRGSCGESRISLNNIEDNTKVNGKEATTLYKFLKSKKGGSLGDDIKWNFTKFFVDKDEKVVKIYTPTTSPLKIEEFKCLI